MVSSGRSEQDVSLQALKRLVAVARGEQQGDLLLEGGRLVDVFSGKIREVNVLIHEGRIAGIGNQYREAEQMHHLRGAYLLPGLIDGHVHVESSHLTLAEFARAVSAHVEKPQ